MLDHLGVEGRDRVAASGEGGQVGAGEDIVQRTLGAHLSGLQHHHPIRQPGQFGQGVGDIKDRQTEAGLELLEIGHDLRPSGRIERRQGLVHQQHAGLAEQGPADGHPLALAAGQVAWPAREQVGDPQHRHHLVELGDDRPFADPVRAVTQVAGHIEVGEQPRVLEHPADGAALHGDVDPAFGIEQHLAVQHDTPLVGSDRAGDGGERLALSGPGRAEQRRHPFC